MGAAAEEQAHQKPARVLVVDDDQDARALLSSFLGWEGYEAITAMDGEEALNQVRTEHPDLILLDLQMEGMSGLQTIERLKQGRCQVPVVLLTGHAELLAPRQVACLGISGLIGKPFRGTELLSTISRALAEKGR